MQTTSDNGHPYDNLTPDDVLDAVEQQGYLSDARILALNSYENRVYQVGIEDGEPVIVKFYRPHRWSDEQILEEHQFSQILFDLEIPVVPPIKVNQKTLLTHTTKSGYSFRFSLYKRYGGYAPELDNDNNLVILGRFLGRIHAAGRQSVFKSRPAIDIKTYAQDSCDYLLQNNFIPIELETAYDSLCKDIIENLHSLFSRVTINTIRLHGDCHPGNILWRDDRAHFVDFDDARNGPAIQDLWMLASGDRQQQSHQFSKILKGYTQFCDFNMAELTLIEAMRTLRIMHYSAWLAKRWSDPAFPQNFPWFNTQRYWSTHILELREQLAAMQEPGLTPL